MKLLIEGPLSEQKRLTTGMFTTTLNDEVEGGCRFISRVRAAVAWYNTHNTRWILTLIAIIVNEANESPIVPGISLPPVVWMAANGYHFLLCFGVVLMVLCAAPDTAHPIVIKIRLHVRLQNEE